MRRKLISMLVTVSVPAHMKASDARREIRTLINEQTNYTADPDEIRARSIKPLPRSHVEDDTGMVARMKAALDL